MAADRWCIVILHLWTSLHFLLGSAEILLPPSNISFAMDGVFCLVWGWNSPKNSSCSPLIYSSNILSNGKQTSRRNMATYIGVPIRAVDLNKEFIFEVKANCDSGNIASDRISLATQLVTGDRNTSVRNFNCVWYNMEYVNCTWEPGQDAPPSVNYSLSYWSTSSQTDCSTSTFAQSRQFQDLLRHGNGCQSYTYSNAVPTGCRFAFQERFHAFLQLLVVVSDWSQDIRPHFYFTNANNIVKLRPPVIQDAYRTKNQSIYITWEDLHIHNSLIHEVQLEMSNSKRRLNHTDITGLSKEIYNVQSDVTYIVRVRVRLPKDSTHESMHLWSDWSEEKILPGQDEGRTLSLLLLLLIPAVVIVAAVLLLIYMKRLKILIVPRIPDPGRVLSNDLQQWIKSGRTAYSEPKKEEICPVSLLETPLASPYAE